MSCKIRFLQSRWHRTNHITARHSILPEREPNSRVQHSFHEYEMWTNFLRSKQNSSSKSQLATQEAHSEAGHFIYCPIIGVQFLRVCFHAAAAAALRWPRTYCFSLTPLLRNGVGEEGWRSRALQFISEQVIALINWLLLIGKLVAWEFERPGRLFQGRSSQLIPPKVAFSTARFRCYGLESVSRRKGLLLRSHPLHSGIFSQKL